MLTATVLKKTRESITKVFSKALTVRKGGVTCARYLRVADVAGDSCPLHLLRHRQTRMLAEELHSVATPGPGLSDE